MNSKEPRVEDFQFLFVIALFRRAGCGPSASRAHS